MHIPVLLNEVIDNLKITPGKWYLDGTFGRGGHTKKILEAGGRVVAFDMDPEAVKAATKSLSKQIETGNFIIFHANFNQIDEVIQQASYEPPFFAGALFDLGTSSNQIEDSQRGFSFQGSEPLDMRMDPRLGVTAADLVNALPERHLKNLFWEYAQETQASRIASEIVKQREKQPLTTTDELVAIVTKVKGRRPDRHIHPATKVFQALRIAVNTEMDNLENMLKQVLEWITPDGRLLVISFHEGEDRIVKQTFKEWERQGKVSQIQNKPIMPSEEERQENHRSRSAKLRVCQKQ